jgi:hypothetical protein
MPKLDLNAKRAERAAKRGEPMTIEIANETFELVPELPLAAGEFANSSDIAGAMKMLLAHPDTDWPRFMALTPTMNDVLDIVEYFGAQLGESQASTRSSVTTGTPSRPTSPGSTDSTSPTPVTDPTGAPLAG